MSYSTGTAATPATLKVAIDNFAIANGFTQNGDWLGKNGYGVKIYGATATGLFITGANSEDGLTEPSGQAFAINILEAHWGVTYELFYTADQLSVVVTYADDRVQAMMWGSLVKISTSAYVGGNWFWASSPSGSDFSYFNYILAVSEEDIRIGGYSSGGFPFPTSAWTGLGSGQLAQIHCKMDEETWLLSSISPYYQNSFTLTDYTRVLYTRSPNSWNNQAHLIPLHIQKLRSSGLQSYIARVDHIRLIRIDNYPIGEIIDLGASGKWKVYPWVKKGSGGVNVATTETDSVSQNYGFAVRYEV